MRLRSTRSRPRSSAGTRPTAARRRWTPSCTRSGLTARGSPPSSTPSTARARVLETTNREVARAARCRHRHHPLRARGERALNASTPTREGHAAGHRHHQRPPVPHGLRGRRGGASHASGRGSRRAHRPAARALRRDRRYPAHGHGGAHARRRAGGGESRSCSGSSRSSRRCRTRAWSRPIARQATQAAVVAALNAAAERIENITKRLNQTVGDGGVAMG